MRLTLFATKGAAVFGNKFQFAKFGPAKRVGIRIGNLPWPQKKVGVVVALLCFGGNMFILLANRPRLVPTVKSASTSGYLP